MLQNAFYGERSEIFEFKTGLRQGDAPTPVLFNLALEKVIRDSQEKREINQDRDSFSTRR